MNTAAFALLELVARRKEIAPWFQHQASATIGSRPIEAPWGSVPLPAKHLKAKSAGLSTDQSGTRTSVGLVRLLL